MCGNHGLIEQAQPTQSALNAARKNVEAGSKSKVITDATRNSAKKALAVGSAAVVESKSAAAPIAAQLPPELRPNPTIDTGSENTRVDLPTPLVVFDATATEVVSAAPSEELSNIEVAATVAPSSKPLATGSKEKPSKPTVIDLTEVLLNAWEADTEVTRVAAAAALAKAVHLSPNTSRENIALALQGTKGIKSDDIPAWLQPAPPKLILESGDPVLTTQKLRRDLGLAEIRHHDPVTLRNTILGPKSAHEIAQALKQSRRKEPLPSFLKEALARYEARKK